MKCHGSKMVLQNNWATTSSPHMKSSLSCRIWWFVWLCSQRLENNSKLKIDFWSWNLAHIWDLLEFQLLAMTSSAFFYYVLKPCECLCQWGFPLRLGRSYIAYSSAPFTALYFTYGETCNPTASLAGYWVLHGERLPAKMFVTVVSLFLFVCLFSAV